ncbi:TetR/AcrR family transcriptional regulator [Candidatus Izimaplasma bacterium ZiA1]|uniref:TetR/AcrR family transcriptional regulator n=1 Tax=Candidatus Izimoplasma sp. ZiA1 TaxID=2024899 RepID=UPI001439FD2C
MMNSISRQKRTKEQNKKDIVSATEKLLFKHNLDYKSVKMNDIAIVSGFTKRTIYSYFPKKEDIHFEVMINAYLKLHKYLDKNMKHDSDENELLKISKAFYAFSEEHSNYFWVIMDYQNGPSDFAEITTSIKKCYELGEITMMYIRNAIIKGIKLGEFRKDLDIESSVLRVWSFSTGLLNTLRVKNEYIKNYYHINKEDFVKDSLCAIVNSLK